MKQWYRILCLLSIFMVMTISCRQLFTTSLGASMARDKVTISNSTSLADLVTLAQGTEATSPEGAKEILRVLGKKSADDITALSVDDKASILNLATTAAIDMGTLTDLAKTAADGTATDDMITTALSAFDTSVDMTAIETILGDTESLQTAPVDSLVLAAAVVMADVADVIGTTQMMDILASGDTSSLAATPDIQAQMDLILNARTAINTRDSADVTVAGFNLTDLLKGTQP